MKKKNMDFRESLVKRCFLAFLIPLLLNMFIFYILNFYPMGENIFIRVDANHQYIRFLEFFRKIIYEGNIAEFIYSFSNGFGHSGALFFAYYLSSPFNILSLMLYRFSIENVFVIIMFIKISCLGVAFYYFIEKCLISLGKWNYVFSTAYTFIGFVVMYSMNIMWLDSLILLPIIISFFKEMVETGKVSKFVLVMTLLYLSNFYMAYIICLFITLLLVLDLIFNKKSKLELIKIVKLYAVSIVISILLFGVMMMPILFELKEFYLDSPEVLNNKILNIFHLVSKMFAFQFDTFYDIGNEIKMTPYLYFGLLPIIFALFYLLFDKNSKYKKILLSILVVLIFSFIFDDLNIIWHAFENPTGFNYRYSFLFSFVGLIMGHLGLKFILEDGITKKQVKLVLIIVLLMLFVLLFNSSLVFWSINLFLILIYVYFLARNNLRDEVSNILILIFIVELFCNSVILNMSINSQLGVLSKNEYYEHENKSFINEIIEKYGSEDYRIAIERRVLASPNIPTENGYYGVSSFNSSTNFNLIKSMQSLGLYVYTDSLLMYALDSNYMTDSILSIKYIVSDRKLALYSEIEKSTFKGRDIYLYENPYALPIGFVSKGTINNFGESIEKNQVDLLSSITGVEYDENKLFEKYIPESVKVNDLVLHPNEKGEYILNKEMIEKETVIKIQYSSSDDLLVRVGKEGEENDLLITRVGKYYENYKNDYNSYHYIFDGNDNIVFDTYLKQWNVSGTNSINLGKLYGLKLNNQYMKGILEDIDSIRRMKNVEISGGKVNGVIDVEDKSLLFTSIPYADGWKVKVNDKYVNKVKLINGFLGFYVDGGLNDLEIFYKPKGLVIGTFMTILGIIFLLARIKKFE